MQEKTPADASPTARRAGVGLHLSSLPGQFGIGELGKEAFAFVDCLRKMRLSVWQFLPLGPTGYGNSPYQALSTYAGNEMLIDIEDLRKKRLLKSREIKALSGLPGDYVDYASLVPAKSALLMTAASRFPVKSSRKLRSAFQEFLAINNSRWLHDYALYRILKPRHDNKPWPQWAPQFVHRDTESLLKLEREAGDEIQCIKIQQFLFHEQWQRLREYAHASGVQLFGDIPIYIALDSSDAWAKRDILCIDADGRPDRVGGVPPDYFSNDGQLWGNPLYNWDAHASDGYQWWIDRLRAAACTADILRIDHFRGFESYWSIPADATTARDGRWEPGPGDAIFIALKQAFGSLPIVAEDLGLITPEVEALRDRHQLPGMVVLQFCVTNDGFDLAAVPENSVCYTGTHDNDTSLGWFRGGPGDERSAEQIRADQEAAMRICKGDPERISMNMVRAAYSTPAKLAVAPMQDYLGLGSEARFNTPGTADNNWRWRLDPSTLTDQLCTEIATAVSESGREVSDAPR